jgi:hypothetical protein
MKTFLITLLALMISIPAFAQDDEAVSEFQTAPSPKPISILLDGASIILKGFGAKATYAINENLAIGAIGGFYKYTPTDEESSNLLYKYDYTHRLSYAGLIADGYLQMANPRSKFYISLALTQVKLDTQVNDDFLGISNVSNSSKSGGSITAGWQYAETLPFLGSAGVVFQVGLGYGNAGRIRWSYYGDKTQIEDGLLVDLKAGMQF